MLTRRDLLKAGTLSLLTVPMAGWAQLRPGPNPGIVRPRRFANPLPIPSVIDARGGGHFTFRVTHQMQWLGLRDANGNPVFTPTFGYEGSYPGPTILCRKGTPITVEWINDLVDGNGDPIPHILPIDTSVHWADPFGDGSIAAVPVVTHVHGANSAASSDGLPDAWFTPGYAQTGPIFNPIYTYDNNQDGATTWYHDHALGITRLNVYAGMAGFFPIVDDNEEYLVANNLIPGGDYDIGLAIQDRMFDAQGRLFYPSEPEVDDAPNPSVLPEFFGDTMLVNGMIWPFLEVEPRLYRFRMLNGCDSRFLDLFLSSGHTMVQIATDLGMLDSPVPMTRLVIAPGERCEMVVDFRGMEGQTIVLRNNARSPYPMGTPVDSSTTGQVMAFRVTKPLNPTVPIANLPSNLRPISGPVPTFGPAVRTRKLLLFEGIDEYGRLQPLLGTTDDGALMWHDPITENPGLGDTEIWEVYNSTMDAHPIHLHLVGFRILNRQRFKADQDMATGQLSNIRLIGQPRPPAANELGLKDTAQMFPGEVTRIITRFDRPGEYVWHCHILSHEDHEMMRPYRIGP